MIHCMKLLRQRMLADTLELSSNVAGLCTACNMMLATSAALNSKFHEHLGTCFLAVIIVANHGHMNMGFVAMITILHNPENENVM